MRQTTFSDLRTKLTLCRQLMPEQLLEGFVSEAKAAHPELATTYEARQRHVRYYSAYASEIARRGELFRLLALLESSDDWIAYCAAERLAQYDDTEGPALTTLDRIAGLKRSGLVARLADICRNAIRAS